MFHSLYPVYCLCVNVYYCHRVSKKISVKYISYHINMSPEAHTAFYTMGTKSFQGVKQSERGVDRPPPSTIEVKETVDLYLYSLPGPSWPILGRTLNFTFYLKSLIRHNVIYLCLYIPLISDNILSLWGTQKLSVLWSELKLRHLDLQMFL
jgi:hypothetical protein